MKTYTKRICPACQGNWLKKHRNGKGSICRTCKGSVYVFELIQIKSRPSK